jgi:hypothetical protein
VLMHLCAVLFQCVSVGTRDDAKQGHTSTGQRLDCGRLLQSRLTCSDDGVHTSKFGCSGRKLSKKKKCNSISCISIHVYNVTTILCAEIGNMHGVDKCHSAILIRGQESKTVNCPRA